MVSAANTTLDLGILEVVLLLRLLALILCARLPSCDRPEQNVLSNGGRIGLWTEGLSFFLSELGPMLALGDTRVDDGFDGRFLDAACGFDLFAVFAERVGDYCLAAILVFGDGLRGKGGGELGVVLLFGPVGATMIFVSR